MVDIFIALEVGAKYSGDLVEAAPPCSPSQTSGCAAGSANGSHAQIWAILVLKDHVPDAAEDGLGILADDGPQVGGGKVCWPDLQFMITTTHLP